MAFLLSKYIHFHDDAGHCSRATPDPATCFSHEIWQHCLTFGKNLITIYKAIKVCDTGYVRAVFISLSRWKCTSVNDIMFQFWVIVPPSEVIVIVESLLPVQRSPTQHRDREKEKRGEEEKKTTSFVVYSLKQNLIAVFTVTSGDWQLHLLLTFTSCSERGTITQD